MVRVGPDVLRVDVRQGAGNGPPLLILNGIGAGLEILGPLVDGIDQAVTCIRVDIPGTGGSALRPFPCGFVQFAGLLAGLLDRLGRREVDVLGYSWGGALAQQFAVQYPSRCRRLVLISTSTGALSVPGTPGGFLEMLTPRSYNDPADVIAMARLLDADATARRGLRAEGGDVQGADRQGGDRQGGDRQGGDRQGGGADASVGMMASSATAILGYLQQLCSLAWWTSLPFLPLISQPTLVMSGELDPIVPVANARILAGLIPDARLEIFPGGHAEIISAAATVAAAVSEFLLDR